MTEAEGKQLIINTLETYLKLQLKALSTLDQIDTTASPGRRKSGRRNQSIVDLSINILTSSGTPMHINDLCQRLHQQHGRHTDRDSLSSALAKKARQGILVRQTAPATFALLPPKEDHAYD